MTIQQLNDAFITSLSTDLGRVVITSGVARLEPETIALILDAVRTYDQFDEGIDPYGGARYGAICGLQHRLLLEDRLLQSESRVLL